MINDKLKRVLVLDSVNSIGKEIVLEGWVRNIRPHGKIAFFDLRSGTGIVQIVGHENLASKISELGHEDVVKVTGLVKKREEKYINKNIPTGTIEIEAKALEILAKAEQMPFDMGGQDLDLELPTLLDNRSLTLRHPKVSAIFKVQETIVSSYRKTLKEKGFTEIFVPTLVSSATEGGAEVFSVDYYKHKAYLAQSPQLYKQIMVGVFERVFTIAHAYRAEPSVTTRHLSEYISLDAELGFISSWEDLMDMAEEVVKNILSDVKKNNSYETSEIFKTGVPEIKKQIPRLKLRQAQELIFKRTSVDHRSEPDLDPTDEKEICKWAKEEYGAPFVFITHYPVTKRPFYTMPDSKDPEYSLSFDLLGISEEWVTGGQRINDYQVILEHIKKWGNKPKNFEVYLQAFKYGMPSEGGFAMGLERITKDILGLSNVREASLFPRDMERIDERFSKVSENPKKTDRK